MFTYLDAATGSMIASAIAGGAAGLSVAGKMGMRRLKGKFGKSDGTEMTSADVDNTDFEQAEQVEEELAPETAR